MSERVCKVLPCNAQVRKERSLPLSCWEENMTVSCFSQASKEELEYAEELEYGSGQKGASGRRTSMSEGVQGREQ